MSPYCSGPRTAGAAIALGVERLGEGEPREAIRLFQLALELPGKGAFRMRGSPKEYRCGRVHDLHAAISCNGLLLRWDRVVNAAVPLRAKKWQRCTTWHVLMLL